jgi:hypothetical protein
LTLIIKSKYSTPSNDCTYNPNASSTHITSTSTASELEEIIGVDVDAKDYKSTKPKLK